MMFSVKDLSVLITGATGGIGESICKVFDQQGANLAITGTKQDSLDNLASKLKNKPIIATCDLSNKESIENLIPNLTKNGFNIDVLINSAGITKDSLLMRMNDQDWEKVMLINLDSIFRLSRAAIKGMIRKRFGRVINITSIVGFSGNPGQTNYCASKAAIVGFSKALAREVATRGITVNCIAPGFIETKMTQGLNTDEWKKNIPMNQFGTGMDIAYGAIFLALRESSYITGQTLHINGGLLMC
jgi:3-oxoacyl-[acyl-carrier protein] reductase